MSRSIQRPNRDASPYEPALMTRRAALKAMLGITAVTAGLVANPLPAFAAKASKETTDALNSAQAQLDEAQAKLDAISAEYVELNEKLNDTVSQIEQVQADIQDKQDEIDAKQAEIADKQDRLSARISSNYKTGNADLLSVLLNSGSFEELSNNLYYLGKINASDEQLISDVKRAKAELDTQKAELEQKQSELEQLKQQQTEELAAVQAKQNEASSIVDNLSDDVRDLMAKRDAEILAAAEEERRQAEAAKAAAAAAANRNNGSSGASGVTGSLSGASASVKGQAIVNACYQVGSPGSGLCAMWVSQVYSRAGLGYPGGNANNMYWNFCTSSNKADLQPGMIIAVSTWTGTAAGRVYGHVGIYIGGGMVMHNVGSIQTMGVDAWIGTYGTTVTPRWGWAA